jgi:hypothetical protein
VPSGTGAAGPFPLSRGMPGRGRRRPSLEVDAAGDTPVVSHRTAVEAIEAAGVAARAEGHTLAGFVRRCTTTGCSFIARCRTCRVEVAVQRSSSGWSHSVHMPPEVAQEAGRPGCRCAGGHQDEA